MFVAPDTMLTDCPSLSILYFNVLVAVLSNAVNLKVEGGTKSFRVTEAAPFTIVIGLSLIDTASTSASFDLM